MAHLAAELVAHLADAHLVVAPQRAVHQQAVGARHPGQQGGIHLAEAGGVEQRAAAGEVLDEQADVVARMRVAAVRRVRRRAAAQRDGGEAQARAGGNRERCAGQLDGLPAQAAVPVGEHVEQREAAGQVLVDHLGAPHLVRATFAQAEQAGGVVDLAVEQDDPGNRCIAQAAGRLQGREGFELGADVRRGIAQDPVDAVVAEGDRRLGARPCAEGAGTDAAAVAAVAVPLREATAGGGAENLDAHGREFRRKRPGRSAGSARYAGETGVDAPPLTPALSPAGRGSDLASDRDYRISGWRSTG
ncbi:hypothetical protein FQZ97_755940 [compost metagenome]